MLLTSRNSDIVQINLSSQDAKNCSINLHATFSHSFLFLYSSAFSVAYEMFLKTLLMKRFISVSVQLFLLFYNTFDAAVYMHNFLENLERAECSKFGIRGMRAFSCSFSLLGMEMVEAIFTLKKTPQYSMRLCLFDNKCSIQVGCSPLEGFQCEQLTEKLHSWYIRSSFGAVIALLEKEEASYFSPMYLRVDSSAPKRKISVWNDLLKDMGLILSLNNALKGNDSEFFKNSLLDLVFQENSLFRIRKEINHKLMLSFFNSFVASLPCSPQAVIAFARLISLPWPALGDILSLFEFQLNCHMETNQNRVFKICLHEEGKLELIVDSQLQLLFFLAEIKLSAEKNVSFFLPLCFNLKHRSIGLFATRKVKEKWMHHQTIPIISADSKSDWMVNGIVKLLNFSTAQLEEIINCSS